MSDVLLDTVPLRGQGERGEIVPVLGRYVIHRLLGRGAMAEVHEATDAQLDRKVALKLIPAGERPELSSLLWHEALMMGKLSHPNVVQVYDVGMADGRVYIAMELVEGESLERWLATPRSWREITALFLQAARGLSAAHATDIVHRDFKPANVMVGRDGRVRVADFGVATLRDSGVARGGTPFYMAPEQLDGTVDARTDQFAFCVALYHAWCGKHPYGSEGKPVLDGSVTPVAEDPRVPAWAWRAVLRGLALDPAARFPTMDALARVLAHDPWQARRRWAVGIGAIALASGAGFLWARHDSASPCSGAADKLATVWSPEARQQLGARFEATKLSYAGDTAGRTIAAIETHATAWSAMRIEACRANKVRGEESDELLDRRMSCLDLRLAELRGTLDVFRGEVDRGIVDGAVRAIAKLTPLDTCADAAALRAQEVAPPAQRARVDELGGEIARADATIKAGKIDVPTAPLETAARETKWPGVIGPALFLGGYAQYELGKYDASETKLREAARIAARAHDDRLVARALGVIAFDLVDGGRNEPALVAAQDGVIATARAGRDPLLEAQAGDALGYALDKLSRYPEGRAAYEAAIATLETARGVDDVELGPILNNWASLEIAAGDLARARTLLTRALAIFSAKLGPTHPYVATALNNLGNAALQGGEIALADRHYAASLAIKRAIFPADHPAIATALHNLGNAALEAGRFDDAERDYREALAIRETALAKEHTSTLETRYQLAMLQRQRGKLDEALAAYRDVLDRRIAKFGEQHTSVGNTLDSMAAVYVDLGELDQALAFRKRALAIREKVLGPDNADVAETVAGIAEIYELRAQCPDATAQARRALAIFDKAASPATYVGRASPLATLAACAARAGDTAGARAQYEAIAPLVAGHPVEAAVIDVETAKLLADPAQAHVVMTKALALLPAGSRKRVDAEKWLALHPLHH